MGYLFDSDRGVYIHESLVDENGHYDADILNENIHAVINNNAAGKKFNKKAGGVGRYHRDSEISAADTKFAASKEKYKGSTSKEDNATWAKDSWARHPQRTSERITAAKAKGVSARSLDKAGKKHDDKIEKRQEMLARYKSKNESYDYSTEFFSGLELK